MPRMLRRMLVFAAVLLLSGFALWQVLQDLGRTTALSSSQEGGLRCDDFIYQEDAQMVYEQNKDDHHGLDHHWRIDNRHNHHRSHYNRRNHYWMNHDGRYYHWRNEHWRYPHR